MTSSDKLFVPEMFIFVVFDLGKDPFSIDVKIIFLDPGFPVLTLSVSRQSLLVCSNALGFIFVCEIVCDFAPHLDLSKPLRRFFRSSLLSSVLLVSPVSLRNMLIRSSHILWTQLNHELRHDFCPHKLVMTLGSDLLVVSILVIKAMIQWQVLVEDVYGRQLGDVCV